MKKLLALAFCSFVASAPAAVIQFDLIGTAGSGLRFGNETGVLSGGTGGEFGTGITFDDVSKIISINVQWGSANGFANLTGTSTNAHLHATTIHNGDGFTQTGGVVVNLQTDAVNFTTNTSASAGSIVGSVALNAVNEASLLDGRLYLNVHTAANPGGEMRGFLVPVTVPEPASALFGVMTLGAVALRRRRA